MSVLDRYTLCDYGAMVADSARTSPFVEALKRHITHDSVVLDIGTGAGFFALLACQLGARRVFAVEPDDSIEVARLCAAKLPGSERIEWIRGLTTDMVLPEPADVVVGDLHGVLPFYVGNIPSMIDARKRLLKPGGVILPRRDTVWMAPAQAEGEYRQAHDPWQENSYGIDLRAGRRFIVNHWWRAASAPVPPEAFLASPAVWADIDYRRVESPNVSATLDWEIGRAGTLHGYYVWFDGDVDEGLGTSNSPLLPELIYGRAFFPLEQPVALRAGDRVQARVAAQLVSGRYVMRWDTDVQPAGAPAIAFRQNTLKGQVLRKEDFDRGLPTHRPELSPEGRTDLFVLEAMGRGEPLERIAVALAAAFPARFASADSALEQVAKLSRHYSGGGAA